MRIGKGFGVGFGVVDTRWARRLPPPVPDTPLDGGDTSTRVAVRCVARPIPPTVVAIVFARIPWAIIPRPILAAAVPRLAPWLLGEPHHTPPRCKQSYSAIGMQPVRRDTQPECGRQQCPGAMTAVATSAAAAEMVDVSLWKLRRKNNC